MKNFDILVSVAMHYGKIFIPPLDRGYVMSGSMDE